MIIYECVQHVIKQKSAILLVYDLDFDDVTSSSELKYRIRSNFENYLRFLKIPTAESYISKWTENGGTPEVNTGNFHPFQMFKNLLIYYTVFNLISTRRRRLVISVLFKCSCDFKQRI